jgi:hypothetical protein
VNRQTGKGRKQRCPENQTGTLKSRREAIRNKKSAGERDSPAGGRDADFVIYSDVKRMNMKIIAKTVSAALVLLFFVGITGTAAAETIGGDQGWYVVHANVDGADVYFDGDYKGQIANGELNVPVYTTGTPYQTYTVSKEGYTTYTAEVSQFPAKGETVDLYATLNPATPAPTQQAPLSPITVLIGILGAGMLLVLRRM